MVVQAAPPGTELWLNCSTPWPQGAAGHLIPYPEAQVAVPALGPQSGRGF